MVSALGALEREGAHEYPPKPHVELPCPLACLGTCQGGGGGRERTESTGERGPGKGMCEARAQAGPTPSPGARGPDDKQKQAAMHSGGSGGRVGGGGEGAISTILTRRRPARFRILSHSQLPGAPF